MTAVLFALGCLAALFQLGFVCWHAGYRRGQADMHARVEAWGRTQQRTPR